MVLLLSPPMIAAETLVRDATALDARAFARKHGGFFLLRLPLSSEESWDEGLGYDTAVGELPVPGEEGVFERQRALAGWRVAPLVKRDGNLFPERVSVGRAQTCDVVLRMPRISKLHAHFLFDAEGRLLVRDQFSSNGTTVNTRRIRPGEAVPVRSGAQIGFGRFETELIDAAGLRRFLTRKVVASDAAGVQV